MFFVEITISSHPIHQHLFKYSIFIHVGLLTSTGMFLSFVLFVVTIATKVIISTRVYNDAFLHSNQSDIVHYWAKPSSQVTHDSHHNVTAVLKHTIKLTEFKCG